MNAEEYTNKAISFIPEGISTDEWYALDLNDPLMAIC